MGARNAWDNTLASAAPLTREKFEEAADKFLRVVRDGRGLLCFEAIKQRPKEVMVEVDLLGYKLTFIGVGRWPQSFSRLAARMPAFVPLEGRLALRLMRQLGGGLTAQQRLLCRVVAEIVDG